MLALKRRNNNEVGFGKAFWLLILLYSFEYIRWQAELPILGYLKIPGLLTAGFLLWWFSKGDKKIPVQQKEMRYAGIFLLLMALSISWAIHRSAFWGTYSFAIQYFALVIPVVCLLDNYEKMMVFFKYWVAIHLLSAMIVIRNGGKGNGSFMVDENDVSLCLCMGIPYAFYLLQDKSLSKKWKLICWAGLLLMIVGVVISFSRGGFLGLAVVILSLLWFSKNRIRNAFLSLVAAVILGGAVLAALPPGYIEDMQTINDPKDSTRVERFRSWEVGWLMFLDNPIFGVGAWNYRWNVEKYQRKTSYWVSEQLTKNLQGRQAHSLYFTLIPEMGLAGITVFLLLIGSMVKTLLGIRRSYRILAHKLRKPSTSEAEKLEKLRVCDLLAKAMLVAMIGFFVSGAFISVLYYPHIWVLAGFVAVLGRVGAPIIAELSSFRKSAALIPVNHAGVH